MTRFSRRVVWQSIGAGTVAAALVACSGGDVEPVAEEGATAAGGSDCAGITWWDHFGGLQDMHQEWAAQLSEEIGVPIEYTYNEPARAVEGLQLANQSDQLPDVYSNILGLPLPALIEAGWLHPIDLPEEAVDRLPEGTFVEGITMLDGDIYGLPVLSDRQYWAATWYNSEIAEEVGFEAPRSYDDLLTALQAIDEHGEYAPMTLALGFAGRMQEQVDDLAQAGGFPGYEGLRFDTGEYNYDHESYIEAIELLKTISDNGWLLPGTNSFQIPDARGRWAAGNVGFFIDGPWSPGGVRNLNADHLPRMATAGMLTPDGDEAVITRGAPDPTWFIAGNTDCPEAASELLASFTRDEYQVNLAEAMDQPPINLGVVEDADVIEPYAWIVDDFQKRVFRAPQPVVRNVDVTKALAYTTPISPGLGDIVQGYLGGDITDLRGELQALNDRYEADLTQAIERAQAEGADVSRDDWAFPDWERGEDYTY
ncbi:ABC transporter substrate-binding protein [uncultured Cellulomonas sp.]|uniref:ABC transporter substrate-binding protein n=1 Tax=uncultured Cellulomonas sp. TaxID=189682 RepID=UPI0026030997|nr:ABC transporter substrate-binding protein [uncultured Cellulomonas sp.]